MNHLKTIDRTLWVAAIATLIFFIVCSCSTQPSERMMTVDNGDGTFSVYKEINPYTDSAEVVGKVATYSYNR